MKIIKGYESVAFPLRKGRVIKHDGAVLAVFEDKYKYVKRAEYIRIQDEWHVVLKERCKSES